MKKPNWLAMSLAASMLAGSFSNTALACGPFMNEATLVFDTNPDLPLKHFMTGDLGVVQPTWAKSYLVVAYRELNGKPLTSQQQAGTYSLWHDRIQTVQFSDSDDSSTDATGAKSELKGLPLWEKTRSRVPGEKADAIDVFRRLEGDSYDQFLNCPDGSFNSASKTLEAKITKHGVSSPFVKDWTAAQDLVFCHCKSPDDSSGSSGANAKKPAEPSFPALLKDAKDAEASEDRAYQHAAALFYATQFDAAFKEFTAIENQPNNPYSKISRYMTARCLIRKGTLTKLDKAALQANFSSAEKLVRGMIADKNMQELHSACEELLGFLLFRSDPTNRLKQLSAQLLSDDKAMTAASYYRALDDYTQLLLNIEGGIPDTDGDGPKKKMPLQAAAKNDDLSEWINVWESDDSTHFALALERWHQTKSEAWLLAALHFAPKDKAPTDELLNAARAVKADAPGYLSINYEAAQLHLRRGDKDEAGKEADALTEIARKKNLLSATNIFMDVRGKAPIDVPQFVENSVRVPAAFSIFDEHLDAEFSKPDPKAAKKPAHVFGTTNADFMNERMPLNVWLSVAADAKLPAPLRADAEQAAWVRAVLLNDGASRDKIAPSLQKDFPQLAPLIKATQTGTDEEKKFSAVYLMLKNPGFRPYVTGGTPREEQFGKLEDYGDNWWDSTLPDQEMHYSDKGTTSKSKLKSDEYPKLLSADEAKAGLDNRKMLLDSGAAPTYFCGTVSAYAATHKADPRVPEALYLAVRASHYGHREGKTTPLSKKCFTILHANYGKNPFVAKTPYWY